MASQLRVDNIAPVTTGIAVSFPLGLTVSSGFALTAPGLNATGIVTATSFVGNGSTMTNLPLAALGKVVSLNFIS